MNHDREYVFEHRDLEVMQTAAGQVSVAVENARLFAEEQRRSRHLAFLNNISKTAISSEDSEQMLADIVGHIQKNFSFDHIGIGILDYATKDIEIKAEAGTGTSARETIPAGRGHSGSRGAYRRTQRFYDLGQPRRRAAGGTFRSLYSHCLRRNLSRRAERGEPSRKCVLADDELIMNTLADLLATALHNAFVFQKLQQQSITDGLTGIKTRRFFLEALPANGNARRAPAVRFPSCSWTSISSKR